MANQLSLILNYFPKNTEGLKSRAQKGDAINIFMNKSLEYFSLYFSFSYASVYPI